MCFQYYIFIFINHVFFPILESFYILIKICFYRLDRISGLYIELSQEEETGDEELERLRVENGMLITRVSDLVAARDKV